MRVDESGFMGQMENQVTCWMMAWTISLINTVRVSKNNNTLNMLLMPKYDEHLIRCFYRNVVKPEYGKVGLR